MDAYQAPIQDMFYVLSELAGMDQLADLPGYEEANGELVRAVLEQSARFHRDLVAPLNRSGDQEACRLEAREVLTPTGFADVYRQYTEAGWSALAMNPAFGGQGLPITLTTAVMEMTQAPWALNSSELLARQ